MNVLPFALFAHTPGSQANLTGQELADLFGILQRQNLVQTLFYDGGVTQPAQFIQMMQSDNQFFYVGVVPQNTPGVEQNAVKSYGVPLVRGQVPIGICWLNGFTGSGALSHFCIFRHALPLAHALGRFTVNSLLLARPGVPVPLGVCRGGAKEVQAYRALHQNAGATGPGGAGQGYCLDALYGLTPAVFRHALAYVEALGFQRKGALPYAVSLHSAKGVRHAAAVITCLTRNELG